MKVFFAAWLVWVLFYLFMAGLICWTVIHFIIKYW